MKTSDLPAAQIAGSDDWYLARYWPAPTISEDEQFRARVTLFLAKCEVFNARCEQFTKNLREQQPA